MENYEELEQIAVPEQDHTVDPEPAVEEIAEPPATEPVVQEPVTDPEVDEIVRKLLSEYRNTAQSQPYSGVGVGRKESPFADSPYVMQHQQPQQRYQCGSTYVPPIPPQPPVKPKKEKKPRNKKIWKGILCAVLALAVVAGSCGITAALVNNRWESRVDALERRLDAKVMEAQGRIEELDKAMANAAGNSVSGTLAAGDSLTPGQVYARNVNSVVLISCEVTTNVFGQTAKGESFGSGFILTENGYVVTNAHVVDGATKIYVSIYDGEKLTATLAGTDTTNDVAVLKVEAENLPAVTIGSSSDLIVGDQVVAIGNPLGELTSTMTVGYVSAKDRDVTTDGTTINMIQTDAAINSGNSGGPLFNMKGEVVGITTAKYSGSSSSGASIESIGFAIPIDDVIGMLNDLKDYGYVTGAYLGVLVSNMDAATAAYYRMPVGAYVQEVTPGYCAERAGLKAGDIIVGLGGYSVESLTDLTRALRKFKAGDSTQITVFRSGAEVTLDITLDEKPVDTDSAQQGGSNGQAMPDSGSYEEWYDYFFGNKAPTP